MYSGGSGTSADPYLISTPDDLNDVRNNLFAHFKQINDIDMDVAPYNTGSGFSPIGYVADPFVGVYDGDGYKIENLYINYSSNNVGLFGQTNIDTYEPIIKNIILVSPSITGNWRVGSLIGNANYTDVINCVSVNGAIESNGSGGGLIGNMFESFMYKCYTDNSVNVNGDHAGGCVGFSNSDILQLVRCDGNVSATGNYVGGFSGEFYNSSVERCVAKGNIETSGSRCGGFVGHSTYTMTVDCVSYGNVSAPLGTYVGGFVGSALISVYFTRCLCVGDVDGASLVGGFCGQIDVPANIVNCYYDQTVSGQTDTGKGEPKTTSELKTPVIGFGIYSTYSDSTWFEVDTSSYPIIYAQVTYLASSNGSIVGDTPQKIEIGSNTSPVTATPDTGYEFEEWTMGFGSSADNPTENPRQDEYVFLDATYTASFTMLVLTLTYAPGTNATLIGTSPQSVNYGDNGSPVSVTPDDGYNFVIWSDGVTDNPRQDLAVTDDINVYAVVVTIENYDDIIDIVMNPNTVLPDTLFTHFFPITESQYMSEFYDKFMTKAVMFDTRFGTPYTENNNFDGDNYIPFNGIINDGISLDYRVYDVYDRSGATLLLVSNFYSVNRIDFSKLVYSPVGDEAYLNYDSTPFNKQWVIASKKLLDDGNNKKLKSLKLSANFNKATIYITANYPDDEFYNGLDSLTYDRLDSLVSRGVFSKITVNRSDFESIDPIVVGDRECDILVDIDNRMRFKPIIGKWFHILIVFDFTPSTSIDGFTSYRGNMVKHLTLVYDPLTFRQKRY